MGALKLTACMKVVSKMGEMDQESLLERLDRYTADGVPKDRAQLMAAADTLAELQDERREFMRLLREQHPDLFVVSRSIPEDQDVDPDVPDVTRSPQRDAEELLRKSVPNILTNGQLETYNSRRFDGGDMLPEAKVDQLAWEDHGGMLKRHLYVAGAGDDFGVLRTAWYYPEGTEQKPGHPMLIIEDEDGIEIGEYGRDITRSRARSPSEIFGRDIAPAAIKAYKSLSPRAKGIIDGWNVNWSIGQGKLRDSDAFAEVMTAYEPVREKLRQVYGETIPAYRGEQRKGEESEGDRFLFSWTPMREIATGFAVNRRGGMPPEIPQSKVDEQIEAYHKTGIARLNGYKFVRQDPKGWEPDGPDYYHIYWRGEMQTDGDDIAKALQSEKAERDEYIATLREKGTLYTADIPVDSVAFIPVGANLTQPEFVAEYNPRKDEAQEVKFSPARNDMGFYSALAKGVEDMQTKQAPAGAWKTQIKGLVNKGQVKQDEIEWSGIEDFLDLQQGKVSKDQVLEYLRGNGVQVSEVTLGQEESGLSLDSWLESWADENTGETARSIQEGNSWEETLAAAKREGRTEIVNRIEGKMSGPSKYSQYTLSGGENYREVLLTLPSLDEDLAWARQQEALYGRNIMNWPDEVLEELDRRPGAKRAAKAEYKSSHWDQPNVLAHIRVNDRTDADGRKVLFVEEVQSDFQQDYRKSKSAIKKAVESDFSAIVERMKKAGVLEAVCD